MTSSKLLPSKASIRRSESFVVGGLVLIAVAIRFVGLNSQSLWLDEAYTIYYATTQSWSDVFHNFIEAGENGPLYTLLMKVWIELGTASGIWIRIFSAGFGVLTVPMAHYFYRQILTTWTAVIASGFVALSPMLVWYSQEGRQYSLIAFVSIASCTICMAFIRSTSRNSLARLAFANAVLLAAAFLIHLFAVWLVVMQVVLICAVWPMERRKLFIWLASVMVPSLFLVAQNLVMLGPSTVFGYVRPGLPELLGTTLHVILSNGRMPAELVLGVASFLGACALLVPREQQDLANRLVRQSRVPGFLLAAVAAPLLSYYVFSLVVSPVALPRYFAYLGIPLFGLAAVGVEILYNRVRLVGMLALAIVVVTFAVVVINSHFVPAKADFRSAIPELMAESSGNEIVIIRPPEMIVPVLHYATRSSKELSFRLRPYRGVPEGELLAEMRSAREFWIIDVLSAGRLYPDDLDKVAISVAGHVSEVKTYFGMRVVRLVSGR